MAETAASRLKGLGVVLPTPAPPQANYIPTVTVGRLIFVSGQVSVAADGTKFVGKVGRDLSLEQGREAARICAVNILAQLNAALGDLEKIARLVKLTGFVNCPPDFDEPQKVINGASDFLVAVLGERGRHARSAIGVATLPLGAAVEIEVIAEIA
jgi:enamine deaminase RidA (YjgF/YER057c/UK114 family)